MFPTLFFRDRELFVFDDGEVAAHNFGNYQRFLNQTFTTKNNLTNGKIHRFLSDNERNGRYDGNKIGGINFVSATIEWIENVCKQPIDENNTLPNICIIELTYSGIIGEHDLTLFNLALNHFKDKKNQFMHIHISRIVGGHSDGILKSIQNLINIRWAPDMIVCRSNHSISDKVKEEIARHASLQTNQVINLVEVENINYVPLLFQHTNVYSMIAEKLKLEYRPNKNNIMQEWSEAVKLADNYKNTIKIALVGKYFKNPVAINGNQIFRDSYASVINALNDAGLSTKCKVETIFVWAEDLEAVSHLEKQLAAKKLLEEANGIVITAGFNVPGFEGMMEACKYAREKKKPLLSICYGMQCAVIEFAQNVCNIKGAWSTKLWQEQNDKCNNELPPLKPEQKVIIRMFEGGNKFGRLRLGRRTTYFIKKDSASYHLYGKKSSIQERHRHGYEVNPEFVPKLVEAGLLFTGMGVDERSGNSDNMPESSQILSIIAQDDKINYDQKIQTLCNYSITNNTPVRMEIMELKDHPYYVGVQFHPEFQSRPFEASPPFMGLVLAALQHFTSSL
uniref:CTP synthase n=1 Tax=Panagrolaimus superbus TaxID=310955 RepID=A0A914Z8G2_9BILA